MGMVFDHGIWMGLAGEQVQQQMGTEGELAVLLLAGLDGRCAQPAKNAMPSMG